MSNELDNKDAHRPADGNLTPGLREVPDPGRKTWVRCLMQVLWPAFLGAAITVGVLFSVVDPAQIEWVQIYLNQSREAAYTVGFIVFWALYSLACTITWLLASTEVPKGRGGHSFRS